MPEAPYSVRYTPCAGLLGFAFDPQPGEHALGSDRRQGFVARASGLAWVPPGCDVFSESERGGVYLRIAGLDGPDEPWRDLPDTVAARAAGRLRCMLLTQIEVLEAEAQFRLLAERLVLAMRHLQVLPRGWITPQRLRRIEALIDARQDEPLLVSNLAATLGLSPGFFTRTFREATGRSPHEHVLVRRLGQAMRLIRTTREPLAEVATNCVLPRMRIRLSPCHSNGSGDGVPTMHSAPESLP